MTSVVVPVDLDHRSYEIHIAAGLIAGFGPLISRAVDSDHMVIVTDEIVAGLYLDEVLHTASSIVGRTDWIVVEPGEATKSVFHAAVLWQRLLALKADRRSTVIALGGGVVGDLAGFAAATFTRGLQLVQIPTTLLAQVDSSVGGKVGINLPAAKNMVGAFWQPSLVVIDPDVLVTLDDANFRSALAEVVKYGVIMDRSLFEFLERSVNELNKRDPVTLTEVIKRCCQLKALVVSQDERELTGRRAILNYGHTFAHAIESTLGYGSILHGQAVAIGMACAGRLAVLMQLVDESLVGRQTQLLTALGLSVDLPAGIQPDELIQAMHHDKKVADGQLQFVLPKEIGQVELVTSPDDHLIRRSLGCA